MLTFLVFDLRAGEGVLVAGVLLSSLLEAGDFGFGEFLGGMMILLECYRSFTPGIVLIYDNNQK